METTDDHMAAGMVGKKKHMQMKGVNFTAFIIRKSHTSLTGKCIFTEDEVILFANICKSLIWIQLKLKAPPCFHVTGEQQRKVKQLVHNHVAGS